MDYKRDEVMKSFYATEHFLCDKSSAIQNALNKQFGNECWLNDPELYKIVNSSIGETINFEHGKRGLHNIECVITKMKKERAQELLKIKAERDRLSEERFKYYVRTYEHPEIECCQKKIEDYREHIKRIENDIKTQEEKIIKYEEEKNIIKGNLPFKLVGAWSSDYTPILITEEVAQ